MMSKRNMQIFESFEEANKALAKEMAGLSGNQHLKNANQLIRTIYKKELLKPMDKKLIIEMDHRQRIGQQLKELREQAGLNQTQMAERTGLLQPNIARVEAGKYNVNIDTLNKMAEALGAEIEIKKPG